MENNTVEIINAIGSQWTFLIVLFVIIIFIIKWKTIWNSFGRVKRIKVTKGDAEFELENLQSEDSKSEIEENLGKQEENKSNKIEKHEEDDKDAIKNSYYAALYERAFPKAKKLFVQMLEDEKEEKEKNKLRVINYYRRHLYGDTTAFDEFENYTDNIEDDDELKALAFSYLSSIYADAPNYQKSIELLESAITLSKSDEEKATYISALSEIFYKSGDEPNSLNILINHIKEFKDRVSLIKIYSAIAKYYKKKENKILESVAYQKVLELNPNDTNKIFDAAYSYSEMDKGFKEIGLTLYKKLINYNPEHKGAINNLGVAYDNLNLNIKSIKKFKLAYDKGNSLAAANIASHFIDAGFVSEAEEYLTGGHKMESVHDNIFKASSRIKNELNGEDEKENKILSRADKKYLFFNFYGNAAFSSQIIKVDTSKDWELNGHNVKLQVNKNEIEMSWEDGELKYKILGTIFNNSFNITYKKPKVNSWAQTELYKYTSVDYKGYGYVENSNSIICYCEKDDEIIDFKFKLT